MRRWSGERPRRRRPRLRQLSAAPAEVELDQLAKEVRYVGSAEHKRSRSFLGMPHPRSDATPCPPSLANPDQLTRWLRKAFRLGQVGAPWEGGYRRYAWYSHQGERFEARLVNRGMGEYKGYPITADEWPTELP
jgi:hypothetical protein